MRVIRELETELDACATFVSSRSIRSSEAIVQVMRAMELFLARYRQRHSPPSAHHVWDTDGSCTLEPKRRDDAVEGGDEIIGDEEPVVAHA